MLGRRNDWLPARAEPLRHRAYTITGAEGEQDDFAAGLDVLWRVHIEGREPYEFSETRRAPLWTLRGSGHGRRWYHLRWRAGHGLLRDVGVPCRVHPEKPHKIDIDWSQAYDDHQPAWERRDHVGKAYTQRAEGPLGKLLAPVEYARLRRLPHHLQAEIDQEVEERIAREARLPPEQQAEVDEVEWIAEQGVVARRLWKTGRRTPARVTTLERPVADSLVWTIGLDVQGIGAVEHRQALNDAWAAQLQPGMDTVVMVDPADPTRLTLVS